MKLHSETAAPVTAIIGNGGADKIHAVIAGKYRTPAETATDLAAAIVGARYRLLPTTARLVSPSRSAWRRGL